MSSLAWSCYTTFSHVFCLSGLFSEGTSSALTSVIQPGLRSMWLNHLSLFARSTTSISRISSILRREFELTSSLALILHIQWIIAVVASEGIYSYLSCHRLVNSLGSVQHRTPHAAPGCQRMMLIGKQWKELAELAPCTLAAGYGGGPTAVPPPR